MSAAVLVVVDEDAHASKDVERELRDRYASHYRVVCLRSSDEGRAFLEELAAAGDDVALVLVGLSGMATGALLDEARRLHPHSKRGLLIAWGDWGGRATGEVVFDAMARGRIDHYVIRPAESPDELFHQAISTLLLEWAEARQTSPHTTFVVGKSWSGRAYELRELLGRCAMPHSFHLADSDEGRSLLVRAGTAPEFPVVLMPDGTVLTDPSNAELATASGSAVSPEHRNFDLVIVGAGPAGLSAAVYGASEGFSALVVDQGGLGGQATASSLIRNYLGFSRGVSGRQLAQQAYAQAWVFGAGFAFMQRVIGLGRDGESLHVTLSDSGRVRAHTVLLATGVTYRRLGIPALEELSGAGVYYGGAAFEAPGMAGRDVCVLGGANSAGQAALDLARYASQVTLVVRGDSLDAGMSHYLAHQLAATPGLRIRLGTEIMGGGGNGWLDHLLLRDRDSGSVETIHAEGLFLLIGARPHTEWLPPDIALDSQGFVLTGGDIPDASAWPLDRPPLLLETSVPGVIAAGDVRHGSVKRVASAVGEGSVAIQLVHHLFEAQQRHPRGRSKEAAGAVAR